MKGFENVANLLYILIMVLYIMYGKFWNVYTWVNFINENIA